MRAITSGTGRRAALNLLVVFAKVGVVRGVGVFLALLVSLVTQAARRSRIQIPESAARRQVNSRFCRLLLLLLLLPRELRSHRLLRLHLCRWLLSNFEDLLGRRTINWRTLVSLRAEELLVPAPISGLRRRGIEQVNGGRRTACLGAHAGRTHRGRIRSARPEQGEHPTDAAAEAAVRFEDGWLHLVGSLIQARGHILSGDDDRFLLTAALASNWADQKQADQ